MKNPTRMALIYMNTQSPIDLGAEAITRNYAPQTSFHDWMRKFGQTMTPEELMEYFPLSPEEFAKDIYNSAIQASQTMGDHLTRAHYDELLADTVGALAGSTTFEQCVRNIQPVIDKTAHMLFDPYRFEFPEKLKGEFKPVVHVSNEKPGTEFFVMTRPPDAEHIYTLAQWETLRRTIEYHGGRTIVNDENYRTNSPHHEGAYIYSRDSMVTHNGKIYMPDPEGLVAHLPPEQAEWYMAGNHRIQMYHREQMLRTMIETGLINSGYTPPTGHPFDPNTLSGLEFTPEEYARQRVSSLAAWEKRLQHLTFSEFEGGNVVFDHKRKRVYAGVPTPDDLTIKEIAAHMAEDHANYQAWLGQLGYEAVGIPVPMESGRNAYHLDTFLAALPKGDMIFNSNWLPPAFNQYCELMFQRLGIRNEEFIVIPQSAKDQLLTNVVPIGENKIILTTDNAGMGRVLQRRGYEAVMPSSMGLEGIDWNQNSAGPRCLTLGALRAEDLRRDLSAGR